jgi:peptide/nickel transport system permease protein
MSTAEDNMDKVTLLPREAAGLPPAPRALVLRQLLAHPLGRVGLIIVVVAILVAVLAQVLSPYDPAYQDAASELASQSWLHWFGTDQFGRDILSRVAFGTRTALLIGGLAAVCGGIVGVLIGLLAGYYGGATEGVVMSLVDVILAFPGVLLALLLVVIMGPGVLTVGIALAIGAVPMFARLTRASVLQLREREYVLASRLFGAGGPRIIFTHLLRNCSSPILVQASLVVGISVLTESALSFLGLGIQPPVASWGLMLDESRQFLYMAPWFALAPGMELTVVLVGLVLLSNGLRDVLDVGDTGVGEQ